MTRREPCFRDNDRGQAESFPLPIAFAVAIMAGIIVARRMVAAVVSETTLCAGGCGFWFPGVAIGATVAIATAVGAVGLVRLASSGMEGTDEPDA